MEHFRHSIDFNGFQRISMDFYGFQRISTISKDFKDNIRTSEHQGNKQISRTTSRISTHSNIFTYQTETTQDPLRHTRHSYTHINTLTDSSNDPGKRTLDLPIKIKKNKKK